MTPPSCAEIRPLLPEVALGIADGRDRALALEHIGGCAECRRELEELSSVANDLVALTPPREPPAGFESRVLERLSPGRAPARPRRRAFRRLRVAGAIAAAVVVAVVVTTLSFGADRRLASQYRAALNDAHGQYFQSARLRAADGRVVGNVFGYQGSPSWLFYVLGGSYDHGLYREQIVTRTGRSIALPRFRPAAASWGIATPVPLRDIAGVTLIREPHGPALKASLPIVER
jgi:hypothetical protein